MIPLGLLVKQLAEERALAQAERRAAIVVSVLAVTTDPNAVEQVIASTQNEGALSTGGATEALAVHGIAEHPIGQSSAPAADLTRAVQQRQTVLAPVPDGLAYLEPVEVSAEHVAVVEVHVSDAALAGGVGSAWWALVAVAAGLVLGSAVVGDRLANRLVRPARELAGAANQLGDGNLEVRVAATGPRELAEAGHAFNQMADRLAALRTAEREMVADLSHRLRTPLTGLRLDIEALEASEVEATAGSHPADPAHAPAHISEPASWPAAPATAPTDDGDRHRTLARVRQALATLEHEIDVLIRTTRQATQAAAEEPRSPGRCDASDVVAERMSFWSAVAGDQDRQCDVLGTQQPAPVKVPAAELAAALDAVLGNAFRYTPQGTALEVAVSRHDGWVAVRVDDAGTGILDPDRALRRGASDQGSTGLGLDIARRVAQAGGGSVSVGNGRLGGASVVMLLADAEAPPPSPPSRRGLIGRITREPRLPRQRTGRRHHQP